MKKVMVFEVTTNADERGTILHFATIRQEDAEQHARGIHLESKRTVIPDIWETERTPKVHSPVTKFLGSKQEQRLMKEAAAIRKARQEEALRHAL